MPIEFRREKDFEEEDPEANPTGLPDRSPFNPNWRPYGDPLPLDPDNSPEEVPEPVEIPEREKVTIREKN